ncbi:Glycosyltransferase involved in cell wall bisynthesis [Dethiosulfatibacter aminovorans DSM 17477]|uniref:Glycosyltransferase involved in cell wall bisynthesis n=1 Tax=Dethiosulfatibacter aminovorans DSM 17477 TaxID=1121476 RepID=A0A1M6LNA2_9FIRM|nr:glycosyltransferase [Dethiosulfatibacter aminovorans]SHJ72709.1 Glycosyltransferase involved in cell wall bisynthesis [Dethiosulfatibacter aminovorans DSM 17477]
MRKIRVLFMSDAPMEKPGGAQIPMKILIEELKAEFDIHLISPGETSHFKNHHVLAGNTTMVLSKNGVLKSLKIMNMLRKMINEIEPDIVHVQTSSAAVFLNTLLSIGLLKGSFSIVYTDYRVYAEYGKIARKSIDKLIVRAEKVVATEENIDEHRKIYNTVMRRKDNQRLLFMGPLPPPIGGDTVSFSRIIKCKGFEDYSRTVIDTSRKGGVRITGRKVDFRDITNGLKILTKVLTKLFKHDTLIFYSNRRFLYTVGLGVVLIEKILGKKVIVRVFGGSFHIEMDRLPAVYRKFALSILKKMDYFLVQSKELRKYVVENYGFRDSQVIQYPNFVPDSIIFKRKGVKNSIDSFKCIYLGQIKEEKGVFDIIEAAMLYDGFTCDFYGPIYDRDSIKFEEAKSLVKGINYIDTVEPDNVCRIISVYDLLILPSYHEGEGYAAVVFEAFAAGLPVIVTDWKAFPEFVVHGDNGFIVPIKDPEAIANGIRAMVEVPEVYARLCKGAERTSELYSEKRIVEGRLIPLVEMERSI